MISAMLGVPVVDRNRFRGWIRQLFFGVADEDARMEGTVAIPTLLSHLPDLELAVEPGQLVWNTTSLYGLSALPVRF